MVIVQEQRIQYIIIVNLYSVVSAASVISDNLQQERRKGSSYGVTGTLVKSWRCERTSLFCEKNMNVQVFQR